MGLIEKYSKKKIAKYTFQPRKAAADNQHICYADTGDNPIKKLYIPRKQNTNSMEEETSILGTIDMPFQPTDLEYFADRIACDRDMSMDVVANSLHPVSLKYLFKKETSKEGIYIAYELICHSDIGAGDAKKAAEAFKRLWHEGDFEEQMIFKNKNKRISVLRDKNMPCGEYKLIQGSNVCGPYTIGTIETLCFI